MKKLLLIALLTVSALYAENTDNTTTNNFNHSSLNSMLDYNKDMNNTMQHRMLQHAKCAGSSKCGGAMKKGSSKCGTVKIETH